MKIPSTLLKYLFALDALILALLLCVIGGLYEKSTYYAGVLYSLSLVCLYFGASVLYRKNNIIRSIILVMAPFCLIAVHLKNSFDGPVEMIIASSLLFILGYIFITQKIYSEVVKKETEVQMKLMESKAQSFQESVSLCTHDIAGALHLISFCADELEENYPEDQIAIKLTEGVGKLKGQIDHLRRFNKVPESDHEITSSLYEVLEVVKKNLKQDFWRSFKKIELILDKSIEPVEVSFRRNSLIHFVYNLLAERINSAESLSKGDGRQITVFVHEYNEQHLSIVIEDNIEAFSIESIVSAHENYGKELFKKVNMKLKSYKGFINQGDAVINFLPSDRGGLRVEINIS